MQCLESVFWMYAHRTLRLVDNDDVEMRQTAALGRLQIVLNDLNQSLVIFARGAKVVTIPERVVRMHLKVGETEPQRARTRLELESRIVR